MRKGSSGEGLPDWYHFRQFCRKHSAPPWLAEDDPRVVVWFYREQAVITALNALGTDARPDA